MNSLIIDTSTYSFITFENLLQRLNIIYTSASAGLLQVARDSLARYNKTATSPIYMATTVEYRQLESDQAVPIEYLAVGKVINVVPSNDGYSCTLVVEGKLNESKLKADWNNIRTIRNAKLQESDWVASSIDLTTKCKEKFNSYKNLLRQLPDLYSFPNDVRFPDMPLLEYKKPKKSSSELLSEEEYLEYKASSNMKFLSNWEKFNFTKDRKVVDLLLSIYA